MDISSLSKLGDLSVSVAVIAILGLLLYHLLKYLDKQNDRLDATLESHKQERDALYEDIKLGRKETNAVLRELKTVIDTSNRLRDHN